MTSENAPEKTKPVNKPDSPARRNAPLEQWEDNDLMQAFVDGSGEAYNALMRRHLKHVVHFAYRYTKEYPSAEDIAQDTFIRIHKSQNNWENRGKFTTWMFQIAYRLCVDLSRKKKPHDDVDNHRLTDDTINAEQAMSLKQKKEVIDKALNALPERQRTALSLFYYQELSQKETAEVMEESESAIQSLLFRARQNMAKHLNGLIEEV